MAPEGKLDINSLNIEYYKLKRIPEAITYIYIENNNCCNEQMDC